jgi:flavin reductase (DIM6/NTAB) family NADH-FMN oxidoreductase RutF
MALRQIPFAELALRPFHVFDEEWAVLVAGRERPNPMTVSWGGLGTLWSRPVATVYVRPTRHTFTCLADREFTLNVMPAARRSALEIVGSVSGRDTDKWAASGLVPEPAATVATARVVGARLVLECRVLATTDLDPERFFDLSLNDLYGEDDHHRLFFGEVLFVGEERP